MSTKYTSNSVGLHKLNVNPNCRIEASDEYDCVDIFLSNVIRVEHREGFIFIITSNKHGKRHHIYIHNLPLES